MSQSAARTIFKAEVFKRAQAEMIAPRIGHSQRDQCGDPDKCFKIVPEEMPGFVHIAK